MGGGVVAGGGGGGGRGGPARPPRPAERLEQLHVGHIMERSSLWKLKRICHLLDTI
jgi:hypothetical protein